MRLWLRRNVFATYMNLRIGIAIIGAALPFALGVGGKLYADLPLQDSMSAYYHAAEAGRSMRDWFVGSLFAVGVGLYLYKGFDAKENTLLNIAGGMALGVALFPMTPASTPDAPRFSIHGTCAILLFLCMAGVCIFCSDETLREVLPESAQTRYRRLYRAIGAVMVASPAIAFVLSSILRRRGSLVYFVETVGILAFAAFWLVKSHEVGSTRIERRALTEATSESPPG